MLDQLPFAVLLLSACTRIFAAELSLEVRPLTRGPKHHFFGYIGHVRTIPWNQSGRYIVALQTDFQDRMPGPDDAAEVVLIDTQTSDAIAVLDRSRGWNRADAPAPRRGGRPVCVEQSGGNSRLHCVGARG